MPAFYDISCLVGQNLSCQFRQCIVYPQVIGYTFPLAALAKNSPVLFFDDDEQEIGVATEVLGRRAVKLEPHLVEGGRGLTPTDLRFILDFVGVGAEPRVDLLMGGGELAAAATERGDDRKRPVDEPELQAPVAVPPQHEDDPSLGGSRNAGPDAEPDRSFLAVLED